MWPLDPLNWQATTFVHFTMLWPVEFLCWMDERSYEIILSLPS